MFSRSKLAMVVAEFLGTATLVTAVYTIVARTSFPLFSALAAAGVVAMFTFAAGRLYGGAQINPAVTFGLWSIRKVTTMRAVVFIAAQMLGGVVAWKLLNYFLGHELTSVAGETFEWKVFTAEAVGAGVFGYGVAATAIQRLDQSKTAVVAGLSLFIGILVASLASNAILNPAVALGIQSWNWAYAAAPFAGTLVGMNVYSLLFVDGSSSSSVDSPVKVAASKRSTATKSKSTTRKKTTSRKK